MGRGWGRKRGRGLPVGNAICFIRLFYKLDIQFVLEDLVTDYSVNSQIITITRERGKKGEEGGFGGKGAASTAVSNGPRVQHPSSTPSQSLWRKTRPWGRQVLTVRAYQLVGP